MAKAKRKKNVSKKTSNKKSVSQKNKLKKKKIAEQQLKQEANIQAKKVAAKKVIEKKLLTKKKSSKTKLSTKAQLKFLKETEKDLKKAKTATKRRKARKKATKQVSFFKKHLFAFDTKSLSIVAFFIAIFGAFSIQALLSESNGTQNLQASIAGATRSSAMEAFEISQNYNITRINNGSYYVHPGETDAQIFAFAIDNKNTGLVMKELRLSKVGELEDNDFITAKLYEGENVISEATIHENEFYFRGFSSSIQESTYKEYIIKVDMNTELNAGARFKFEIKSPYDIYLLQGEKSMRKLDHYPIEGNFVTTVGWRR